MANNKENDPEVAAFMSTVMKRLDTPTESELTQLLLETKTLTYSEARKVNRWILGENAPNHRSTMALLRLAGMLNEAPSTPVSGSSEIAGLAKELAQLVERLLRATDPPAAKRPRPAAPLAARTRSSTKRSRPAGR